MELRVLGLKNIREIKRLILEIFSGEPWWDVWTDEQLQAYVSELLQGSNPLSLGLYEDGALIGIALGRVRHWCTGTEYWIDEFRIVPEKQNQGIGTEFLRQIKDFLAEKGITCIVLLTEKTVPAYHFYRRNGFREKEETVLFTAEFHSPPG